MSEPPISGRRRFLATLGLAGLSTTLPAMLARAQSTGGTPAPGAAPPAGAPAMADSTAKKEPPSEDAKALAGIIHRRYQHLDQAQIQKITEDFDDDLKALPRLHAFHLANGDEPDFTFRA